MGDWSKRLQRLQADLPKPEVESLEHLTLDVLKQEKISFGKTHMGSSYEEVWETSPGWIRWFLQHYEQSASIEHQKVIRFIKLKIESMEQCPGSQQLPQRPLPKAAPKILAAKSKAMPGRASTMEAGVPWTEDQPVNQKVEVLQDRMANVENVLNQILIHLTPQSAMSQVGMEDLPEIPLASEFDDPWNPIEDN